MVGPTSFTPGLCSHWFPDLIALRPDWPNPKGNNCIDENLLGRIQNDAHGCDRWFSEQTEPFRIELEKLGQSKLQLFILSRPVHNKLV
jgi:hypothetical protein